MVTWTGHLHKNSSIEIEHHKNCPIKHSYGHTCSKDARAHTYTQRQVKRLFHIPIDRVSYRQHCRLGAMHFHTHGYRQTNGSEHRSRKHKKTIAMQCAWITGSQHHFQRTVHDHPLTACLIGAYLTQLQRKGRLPMHWVTCSLMALCWGAYCTASALRPSSWGCICSVHVHTFACKPCFCCRVHFHAYMLARFLRLWGFVTILHQSNLLSRLSPSTLVLTHQRLFCKNGHRHLASTY